MKTKPHYLIRSTREIFGRPTSITGARDLVRRLGPAQDFYVEHTNRHGRRRVVFNNCQGINRLKVFPFNWAPFAKEALGNLRLIAELRKAAPDHVVMKPTFVEEEDWLRKILDHPGDVKVAFVL